MTEELKGWLGVNTEGTEESMFNVESCNGISFVGGVTFKDANHVKLLTDKLIEKHLIDAFDTWLNQAASCQEFTTTWITFTPEDQAGKIYCFLVDEGQIDG